MTPRLTVIMPVRNAASYLAEALESLERQTERGFVVYAWDDGSDDQTEQVLRQWLRYRVPGKIIGTTRIGIGNALARLVESAPTELIARMDADDLCEPVRLERQLDYMQRHPDTAVLGTQMRRFSEDASEPTHTTSHPLADADLRWAMRVGNPLNHPTVMMRRSAVLQAGNYQDLRPGQDDDLWLRIAHKHRMANLPDALLAYREHGSSVTAQTPAASRVFRERRRDSARIVFPRLGLASAQRLTDLLTRPDQLGVTRRDLALLDRAAEKAAAISGEASDYFKQTSLFQEQRLNLRIRWFKSRPVLSSAWPAVRRLGRFAIKRGGEQTPVSTTNTQRGAA